MILGTQSDCRIKSIKLSESIATITLLIFASKDTSVPKSFWVCIKNDGEVEKKRLNSNTYWIDKINSYNSDTTNVNINKYKEVIVDVDITDDNKSKIIDNHWVRDCYIVLVDAESPSQKQLWSSEKLSLISEEFEIPEIKEISFYTSGVTSLTNEPVTSQYDFVGYINTRLKIYYPKSKKVSYNNRNIHATITIRSIATKKIIETQDFELSDSEENVFVTSEKYQYGESVIVEVELRNAFNSSLCRLERIYRPHTKWSNSFIKTDSGVKRVKAFYVNAEVGTYEDPKQHEGEWL